MKKTKKKKAKVVPSQEFIPIKNIVNGIVETTGGEYVKILEIMPNNFAMRSVSEKNEIIFGFACWLKSAPVSLHFKVITRKAKSSQHLKTVEADLEWEEKRISQLPDEINIIKTKYEEENDPVRKQRIKNDYLKMKKEYEDLCTDYSSESYKMRQQFGQEYLRLVKMLSSHEALTRKFYLIIKYEGSRFSDYNEIVTTLRLATQHVKSALGMCDNDVVMPKSEEEDMFTAEILYNIINRKKCLQKSFEENMQEVILKKMADKGLEFGHDEIPDIPLADLLAPDRVNLSNRKFIYIDGTYYTFMLLSDHGYPDSVHAGWLNPLINAGDGIDVDIFAHREENDAIKTKINNKLAQHIAKADDTTATNNSREDVESAMISCNYIKRAMRSKEDVYYMNVLITISADTLRVLDLKRRTLISNLKSCDMDVFSCPWQFEQAFISALPLCSLNKGLYEQTKRNVTTSGLASTYPFNSFELCDDNGILYGVNNQNESLCIVDIFNSHIYKNANMCYLGTSGGGKTFTLQDFALRLRMRNIQSFVIAPLKGHEFRRACNWIGGQFIKICPGSSDCINLLDIRVPDRSSDEAIEGEGALRNDSLLAKKIQDLKTAFLLLIPEMTNVEEQMLDEALVETYRLKGITHDNASLFKEDDPTQLKEMPIFENLYNVMMKNPKLENVAAVIRLIVFGSTSNFNGHTNVDLDNKYIVFDISELTGKLLPFGMFVVLEYVMEKVKEDRTVRKAVFIDEVWQLIGAGSNKFAAEFVLEIFKTIRGYGGAAIAASQDLNDFFALENGKYGKGILNSSAIKIIKYLEANEAESVQDALDLTTSELREIRRFDRTQGLFCANSSRVSVRFVATDIEKALITTDREELKALKEKGYRIEAA